MESISEILLDMSDKIRENENKTFREIQEKNKGKKIIVHDSMRIFSYDEKSDGSTDIIVETKINFTTE